MMGIRDLIQEAPEDSSAPAITEDTEEGVLYETDSVPLPGAYLGLPSLWNSKK